jgi:hypothetical protein
MSLERKEEGLIVSDKLACLSLPRLRCVTSKGPASIGLGEGQRITLAIAAFMKLAIA